MLSIEKKCLCEWVNETCCTKTLSVQSRKVLYANQSTWRRTEPLMSCSMAVSSVRHGGGYVMAWMCMAATGIFLYWRQN